MSGNLNDRDSAVKKISFGILVIILLAICLCVTSFALVYSVVIVDNNSFVAGEISVNLNNGNKIVTEGDFAVRPGMTEERSFFIENDGTGDVYYKLYFENVFGGLSELIEIDIKDGEKILYSGKMAELTKNKVEAADDVLCVGERRDLVICFRFPENAGNDVLGMMLMFDMCADAVQVKNNPNKEFR